MVMSEFDLEVTIRNLREAVDGEVCSRSRVIDSLLDLFEELELPTCLLVAYAGVISVICGPWIPRPLVRMRSGRPARGSARWSVPDCLAMTSYGAHRITRHSGKIDQCQYRGGEC